MNQFQKQLEIIQSQSLESKKSWYSQVAIAYDQTRPRYPAQLLDEILQITQLENNSFLLEIGCGPGIATTQLAELGFSIVAIEPSVESASLAKEKCRNYSNVEIINTTFEEWDLEPAKFDAVVASTSFHWLDRNLATQKSAATLKPNGFLILLWNTPPQPPKEIYDSFLKQIYKNYAPNLIGYEELSRYQQYLDQFGQELIASGDFDNLSTGQFIIKDISYSIDDYIMLLTTLSPYIRLEEKQRDNLLKALKESLHHNVGDTLNTHYFSAFHLGQKK
ncbi:MAG: class I SAM-dependent methyltransferase [Halothece sp.]